MSNKTPYVLSNEEKAKALQAWNDGKDSLKEVVIAVFGRDIDARYQEGKAVKEYLATLSINPRAGQFYNKKTDTHKLSEEQKDKVIELLTEKPSLRVYDLAKQIFTDKVVSPLSLEYRMVQEFYDTLDPKVKGIQPNEWIQAKEYSPPKRDEQACARINRYTSKELDFKKMTAGERECVKKLIKYCHTLRYINELSTLNDISEREFCESQFIKWTWDKPDLSEEDIDLYINLFLSQLDTKRLRVRLELLNQLMEDDLKNSVATRGNATINMALSDQISQTNKQISDKEVQQGNLIKKLTGDREKRLENSGGRALSMSSLVSIWREIEKRNKMKTLAKMREEKVRQEMKDLSTVDALRVEMFGISEDEIV